MLQVCFSLLLVHVIQTALEIVQVILLKDSSANFKGCIQAIQNSSGVGFNAQRL